MNSDRFLQKVLEGANLKLAAVATDVLGKSGRSMLEALLEGERDPDVLAELARGRLRAKLPELRKALDGRLQPHQSVLITRILAHIDFLEESLADLQMEVEKHLSPFEEAMELVQQVPGMSTIAAAAIIAEIGTDMSRFSSDKHLASWAGVCAGLKKSGGKRLGGQNTHGNTYLRAVLGEVASVIAHSKDNSLSALSHRIARRQEKPKAILAVAHKVLVIIFHLLRTKEPYADLGADYFDTLDATRVQRHHVRRLEHLGYEVTLIPKQKDVA